MTPIHIDEVDGEVTGPDGDQALGAGSGTGQASAVSSPLGGQAGGQNPPPQPNAGGSSLRDPLASQAPAQAEEEDQVRPGEQPPESQEESAEPENQGQVVGSGDYVVRDGECVASIAYDLGYFWETIWNDSNNADLRSARRDPYILLAGDRVFIPDKRPKQEPGATEQRHRFRRRGSPEALNVEVKRQGQPRADQPYILEIDGLLYSGRTDAQGWVRHSIPPNAQAGTLTVGEGDNQTVYSLRLGQMDPISQLSGVQRRLVNLGFDCGRIDGRMTPATAAAIRAFQRRAGLPETGQVDQATRDSLLREHGS